VVLATSKGRREREVKEDITGSTSTTPVDDNARFRTWGGGGGGGGVKKILKKTPKIVLVHNLPSTP
jgi:hypothetical protein